MKAIKKMLAMVLVIVMVLGLTATAFADETGETGGSETPTTQATSGTITLSNATIGESYHLYKLFDVTYGEQEADGKIPTDYLATKEQVDALKTITGNVFAFTEQADGTYLVTVGTKEVVNETTGVTTSVPYTEEEVIAFLNTFIRTLSGGVVACGFPGAVEESGTGNAGIGGDKVATASTVQWKEVPFGYYFVTSSLGAVVSINTSNPDATVTDKNPDDPNWNNEPDEPEPDGPKKDVLNNANQSIDGDKVKVGDTLTYSISYTNTAKEGEETDVLDSLVIKDAAPEGTTYVANSAKAYRKAKEATEATEDTSIIPDVVDGGTITWTFSNVAVDETVEVQFKVTVTEDALQIGTKTVENDADVTVKIGENSYDMKTNKVKNPVEDPDDPVKDVMKGDATESFDGKNAAVNDILTYKITYKNNKTESESDSGVLDKVVITDAAPTGTVYVADSANGQRNATADETCVVEIKADGTITWTFAGVAAGETVTAYFKVQVTEEALSITDKTIVNDAGVKVDGTPEVRTNTVTNPVGEEPHDPNPGKVIVNADGSESTKSTGKFGDTVKFDIGVNAVNLVEQTTVDDGGTTVTKNVQAKAYYIYDQMDPGFTLDPMTMKVKIAGTEYAVEEDSTVTEKADGVTVYKIQDAESKKIGTLFTKETNDGTLIEATIPWAKVETNGESESATTTVTALYPNCKIHLTYNAVINEGAVIAGDGNVNKVRYDYSTVEDTTPKEPDPTNPKYPEDGDLNHGSDEKTTVTYTYALGLQKYSAETGEPLEGAQFKATDAGGNPIYGVEVKDAAGKVTHYNYIPATDEDAQPAESVDTFVTNPDGQIIIKGVDVGTYTFTEVEAPKGYNLLDAPVTVTAQMDSSTVTEKYNKTDWTVTRTFEAITEEEFNSYTGDVYEKSGDGENKVFTLAETKPATWSNTLYKLTGTSTEMTGTETGSTTISFPINIAEPVDVSNNAGSLLPSTGGMGTTIFYVLGSVLLISAAVLLITKKRMNAAE